MAGTMVGTINPARLQQHLEELGGIGRTEQGGIWRPSLRPEDLKARELVSSWMREAGLTVRLDAACNLIGRSGGGQGPVLIAGSHIDTVPNGGRFDGALGVLAAIEAAQSAREQGYTFRHPLEIIAFTDEEGAERLGCLGSSLTFAEIPEEILQAQAPGHDETVAERLTNLGIDIARAARERRDPKDVLAYLELHIEQGGILEHEGLEIGVVEGIVGIRRYEWTITGLANHAGTTPMHLRQDALLRAAILIQELNRLVRDTGEMVGTVGHLTLEPNAVNVIPSLVQFSEEIRGMDSERMDKAHRQFVEFAATIPGTQHRKTSVSNPIWLTPEIRDCIAELAAKDGRRYRRMVSGAGHDAAIFAVSGVPTGMIFVPSKAGISHSPQEWTDYADCARGAELLMHTLLQLDRAGE